MAVNKESPAKSKTQMARQLGISRQSLYYQRKMPVRDLALKTKIEKVMADNKAYGHKRVAWALTINRKRANRVMKLFGLKPQRHRKPPKKPKDSNQVPMVVPNLIQGTIIETPNNVWVCDFTYLPFFGKFAYLATVEDIFTREIAGWEVSVRHSADLVAQALLNSLKYRQAPQISHSDQGSEYRSKKYQALLQEAGIKPSMSEKASPWQNGFKESFYSEFKLELGHPECYPTLGELVEAIAQQIHYYNNRRIHTALKCPPAVFASKYASQNMTTMHSNSNLTFQAIAEVQSV